MPVQGIPLTLADNKNWKFNAASPLEPHSNLGWNLSMYVNAEPPKSKPYGRLVAWDPVAQKETWVVEHVSPWNGGTLTTAGNLVFQGTADGRFIAYDARDGKKLWEAPTGTGVVAAPSTYEVDGQQYVSIAVGWGGVYGIAARATERKGPGTVYTFAIGGKAAPPAFVEYKMNALLQGVPYDKAQYEAGTALYVSNCAFCHGVPGVDRGGNVPNLGYSSQRGDRRPRQVAVQRSGDEERPGSAVSLEAPALFALLSVADRPRPPDRNPPMKMLASTPMRVLAFLAALALHATAAAQDHAVPAFSEGRFDGGARPGLRHLPRAERPGNEQRLLPPHRRQARRLPVQPARRLSRRHAQLSADELPRRVPARCLPARHGRALRQAAAAVRAAHAAVGRRRDAGARQGARRHGRSRQDDPGVRRLPRQGPHRHGAGDPRPGRPAPDLHRRPADELARRRAQRRRARLHEADRRRACRTPTSPRSPPGWRRKSRRRDPSPESSNLVRMPFACGSQR